MGLIKHQHHVLIVTIAPRSPSGRISKYSEIFLKVLTFDEHYQELQASLLLYFKGESQLSHLMMLLATGCDIVFPRETW